MFIALKHVHINSKSRETAYFAESEKSDIFFLWLSGFTNECKWLL